MRPFRPLVSGRIRSIFARTRHRHFNATIDGRPLLAIDCDGDMSTVVILLDQARVLAPTSDLVTMARAILQAAATPGTCWACGCSDRDPCFDEQGMGEACGWSDARATLCTVCARRINAPSRSINGVNHA